MYTIFNKILLLKAKNHKLLKLIKVKEYLLVGSWLFRQFPWMIYLTNFNSPTLFHEK